MATVGQYASPSSHSFPGMALGGRATATSFGVQPLGALGAASLTPSFDFQPQPTAPPSPPPRRNVNSPQTQLESPSANSLWSLPMLGGPSFSLGPAPWMMQQPQFHFEGSEATRVDASDRPPIGWQLGAGAASLAWKRLKYLDALQAESLFSMPLPSHFRRPFNSQPSPVIDTPTASHSTSSPQLGSSQPLAKEVSYRSQPQLSLQREPSTDEDDSNILVHLHRGLESTWEILKHSMDAMSGAWCMHEGPPPGGYQPVKRSLIGGLERSLLPVVNTTLWSVRTSPPTAASAQPGGSPSPIVAFRGAPVHEALDPRPGYDEVSGAPAIHSLSANLRQGPTNQLMPPQEINQVLAATLCSICSLKGNKATAPNQDRAVAASLGLGSLGFFALFDGHGEVGHDVAEVCAQVLPKVLLRRLVRNPTATSPGSAHPAQNPQEATGNLTEWWREGSINAFEEMHALLEALTAHIIASDDKEMSPMNRDGDIVNEVLNGPAKVDSRTSGTTATVVLTLPGPRLLLAHAGDSRAVLGVRRRNVEGATWRVQDLTRDHKPDLPDEKARIELFGAQVVTVGVPPNTTCRVFTPQQFWPSINMSRSLGDLHAHSQGLSSEAEASFIDKPWDRSEEAVLVLASDGIWDVLDGQIAVEIAWHAFQQGGDPANALVREAYERWARRGLQGGYTDDITAIVKFLS